MRGLRHLWGGMFAKQTSADDAVLVGQERRFRIGEREIVVRPFTIAEWKAIFARLGAPLREMLEKAKDLDTDRFESQLGVLVPLLGDTLDQALGAIFEIEPELLAKHLTPLQLEELVRALIEVNQLPLLIEKIRQMGGLVKAMTLPEVGRIPNS